MIKRILKLLVIAAIAVWPLASGCGGEEAHMDHDHAEHSASNEHEGHDHDEPEPADSHQGHDHEDHAGEGALYLSPESISLAGIRVKSLKARSLERTIELPGEIGFNEDRLVHITPRYPGVAREVEGRVGARVREGDLLAKLESNESLSKYSIRAPISGWIIEKHLTVGEFVAEDHTMFVIADLRTVWANCEVYAKDISSVRQGAPITILSMEGNLSAQAVLSYVAPVYREDTRSALARAEVSNAEGLWKPGTFIRGLIPVGFGEARKAVEREAVQVVDGERVVFTPGEEAGEFRTVPVETGIAGDGLIEIVAGLDLGDAYVASGAFELKAKMVTANLDPHAGHGH
jgi:cobalt-zinc-cadmium efflux system membrane fusion protein